jgi:hypothetical protein
MRSKWLWPLIVLLIFLLAGFVSLSAFPWPSRVTAANAGRIEVGMTRARVIEILGPAGDHATGPSTTRVPQGKLGRDRGGPERLYEAWRGDHGMVKVVFSRPENLVVEVEPFEANTARPSAGAVALWRLQSLWARLTYPMP